MKVYYIWRDKKEIKMKRSRKRKKPFGKADGKSGSMGANAAEYGGRRF